MTEFLLRGRVEVDASKGVQALGQAESAAEQLTAATKAQGAAAVEAARGAQAETAALDRHTEATRRNDAATRAANSSTRMHAAGVQQLGMQFGDFTQQLSLGINPMVAFGQQAGQMAYAASMMGGALGKVGTFLAGPFGAIILAATTVIGTQLVGSLTSAGTATDALRDKQNDLANFFDRTTGKVRAQITELQRLALARAKAEDASDLRGQIADGRTGIGRTVGRFINSEATRAGTAFEGDVTRPELDRVFSAAGRFRAGGSAADLAKELNALAKANPALKSLADSVIKAGAEVDGLTGKLREAEAAQRLASGTATDADRRRLGFAATTSSLIEKQVALATATTELERAQARYNLVQERGQSAAAAGGAELAKYRTDLAAAATAVKNAEAAEAARRVGIRAGASEDRDAARAAKEFAAENARLAASFSPLTTAAETYAKALADIRTAQSRGLIDDNDAFWATKTAEAKRDASQSSEMDARLKSLGIDVGKDAAEGLKASIAEIGKEFGEAGAGAFGREATILAEGVGQMIGGKAGLALRAVVAAIDGSRSGDFTALGTRGGGIMTTVGQIVGKPGQHKAGSVGEAFSTAFGDKFKEPFKALSRTLEGLFDGKAGGFASVAGKAFAGAAQGSIASGVAGALGIKQSATGAQLGGALGMLGSAIPGIGPFMPLIGGLLGGTLGGLLMGTKTGSATVSAAGGRVTTGDAVGNSASFRKAADAMGNSVGDAVQALVDQLGGDIGSFSVSIGKRNKKFAVDGSGSDRTKGAGVQKFGSESEAVQAALADAIRDGAVGGVSSRVQGVLREYADNVNKAVAEALKVKGLEDLLANRANPFATFFRDLDRQAKARLDTAKAYGFDVVEIEKINGEERAKAVKDTLARSTQGIAALLDELRFGGRAEGSAVERRTALLGQRDAQAALARGGDQAALEKVASLSQQLLDLDREVFGTGAGAATSRGETVSLLEELVKSTERRIAEASVPKDQTAAKLDTTNSQLDEANDQLSEIASGIRQLVAGSGVDAPIASFNPGAAFVAPGAARGVGGSARAY